MMIAHVCWRLIKWLLHTDYNYFESVDFNKPCTQTHIHREKLIVFGGYNTVLSNASMGIEEHVCKSPAKIEVDSNIRTYKNTYIYICA